MRPKIALHIPDTFLNISATIQATSSNFHPVVHAKHIIVNDVVQRL